MKHSPGRCFSFNALKSNLLYLCLSACLWQVVASDVYYQIPLTSLTLTEGNLPSNTDATDWQPWESNFAIQSYAVLDGPGEAYFGSNSEREMPGRNRAPIQTLSVRAPENQEITGRLFLATNRPSGMVQVRFKISPAEAKPDARNGFFAAKEQFYSSLLDRNIEGAAWFRHELAVISKESGTNQLARSNIRQNWNRNRPTELEDTFDLFTGGRAMSENLQLDRAMAIRNGTNSQTVALTNLPGITVRAVDWKTLLTNAAPELDPLAAFIPADQHAVFFRSFQALTDMTDEADANGTPVLQLFEPRSNDSGARDRYQKQLCLGLNELSRLLGPQVVASAAFTGSDPFLRVGTDVAVLFETKNVPLLQASIAARQTAARAANSEVETVAGDIDGVHFSGVVSPDRTICSYVAAVSNVVFVTNSRQQLETLVHTAQGKLAALNSQDEYRYFRQRYTRSDKDETAFLVLSDAAIRRWCGPKWRIADSRRTRVAAVLADLQAGQVDELVRGKITNTPLHSEYVAPDLGEVTLTEGGVCSSIYGTLDFMTPISELSLTTVTAEEAAAYGRWRDSYQNNWAQFFDPIAVRFSITPQRLTTELTVMPLILGSQYRTFTALAIGAQIAPNSGDPHTNTLARLALAVNNQSAPVQQAGNFVGNMAPGLKANFLSWLGQSVSLYADEDPFWEEFASSTNSDRFAESNLSRLPLGLHLEVKNALGAAAFLVGVHAFADQTAPQMLVWENLEYQGRPYVRISTTKTSQEFESSENWVVYYALTPNSLTVTLSESILKRALDRQLARANTNANTATYANPWMGRSLGLQVQKKFTDVLLKAWADSYQAHLQQLAWNNLPILNEWKRLYPDKDPVRVHEQLWGVKLLCPGGGTYVWNETWHTMESSVLGHPGQPKASTAIPFASITGLNFGLTFENDGLSAKGVVNRNAAK